MLLESGSYGGAVFVSWSLAEMDLLKKYYLQMCRYVQSCTLCLPDFFQRNVYCSIFGEMILVLRCGMFNTITKQAKSVYWLAVKECWIPEWSILILSFVSVR